MFSFRKKPTGEAEQVPNAIEMKPALEKISLSTEDSPPKVIENVATERGALPEEYQALVPEELSKDLAELAVLQDEISLLNEESNGLLGLFSESELQAEEGEQDTVDAKAAKEEKEAVKKENKKKRKADKEAKATQEAEEKKATKKREAEEKEAKKTAKKKEKEQKSAEQEVAKTMEKEEEKGEAKKDTKATKEEVGAGGKFSLVKQIKQVMLQQKELLTKLAAMGNTPIFKPESFNRLLEALPLIKAWQDSGGTLPTAGAPVAQAPVAGATIQGAATPAATATPAAPQDASASPSITLTGVPNTEEKTKESEAEIRKDLGINIAEEQKQPGEISAKEIAKLTKDVADEGFLEPTVQTDEVTPEEAEVRANLDVNEVFSDKQKLSKRELAKREKMEREQEKAWKEEAARRAKEIEKRQKEAEKLAKEAAKSGKKIKITAPKKQKVSKMQGFMMKLNYFGLGKKKDEFIENLGVMMDAGLPLLDALRTLEMEAKEKPYKKLLAKVVVAVETGSPLWRGMQATHFFEGQQISMVKVGEEAGNLVENLRYLAEQSAKQRDLRAKVKTAMIYPIIVFVMLTLIIFGLGMFVLPNLIQIIVSLGVPMPFITRMIVLFTNIFQEHGFVLLPSVAGGAIVLLMLHKYTSFKIFSQWLIMKIPGIGVLIRESILSQFGVTMGGLLQAGVPITDAIESIANTTPIAKYQKFYFLLLKQVKLGDSFGTAFSKIKLTDKCFPGSMQQLIKTGEKSGSLTKIMMKISEIHEKKATDVAEKLPVILEPMLLLFIGSLVGTIALGVLAPIYSIVGNVGGA